MAKAVPVDADAGRFGRQFPGPDDRDGHAFRQDQQAGPDAEAPDGVLQRREGVLAALDDGPAAPLDRVRVVQGGGVGAQRLLLSDLRSVPEPRQFRARGGEQLAELAQRRLPAGLLLVDGFVPQPPAPAPLIEQRSLRGRARPQPVGVTHGPGTHSNSIPYFVATVGGATPGVIKRYVENQRNV